MDTINIVDQHTKPSLFWLATEAGRAMTELGLSIPYRALYKTKVDADSHPVLIIPGFMATDKSTKPLRDFVDKLGHVPIDWGLGRNYGKEEYFEHLLDHIDELKAKHNTEISIIGWSLGGVYARQLAKAKPDAVRQVITLGSPFLSISTPNHANWIYKLISGKSVSDSEIEFLADLSQPAPVPTTAIYTKEDGVVNWNVCKEKIETDIHQNIRVRGSHLGLGVNPTVLNIIADRLKHDKEKWKHFSPRNMINELLFYPGNK